MDENIGKEFMRRTAHARLSPPGEASGVPQPPLELPIPASARRIELPGPPFDQIPAVSLLSALGGRRSIRQYSRQALTLEELSFLLWATQGVQEITDRPATLRPVPSAGARHAFETHLLVHNVENLPAGIYRYAALENQLIELSLSQETAEGIALACRSSQAICRESTVTFIWAAVTERMTWRYSERGYRFLHLDAGHVCQNLYLAAEAVGCGVCAIGGYNDIEINSLLGLDGDAVFVIYLAAAGKR
ncbi:MAG: SagB/ThcOx family dehydrogenase [Anaerolineales bacterium]|nr:SagB/ThcOx family dehydrogenase [Anaerolineales bacterium]